jgi:hypothetical protein
MILWKEILCLYVLIGLVAFAVALAPEEERADFQRMPLKDRIAEVCLFLVAWPVILFGF